MDGPSPSQPHSGSTFRPPSGWSETSQPSTAADSMAQRTSHGKRKNRSYNTESELDRPGSGDSPTVLNSATAPSVVPAPRASASSHQRRRRRQRRGGHSSGDFTVRPSEGEPHGQPQGNSEGAPSSPGQDSPSATPGTNPGGSTCPTCWLCRGLADSGRVVELVGLDRGPAVSLDSTGWMPDIPGEFGTNTQDIPSYSLQPVGQPAEWEATDMNSAQFQVPRFPDGWAGNEQGDGSSMAWSADAYGDFGNVSSYTSFPGSSVPFTPTSGGVGSNAGSMGGYSCHPAGGQDSVLLTPFDGGLTGSDGGFMAPPDPFLSGLDSEPADVRRMGGLAMSSGGRILWHNPRQTRIVGRKGRKEL